MKDPKSDMIFMKVLYSRKDESDPQVRKDISNKRVINDMKSGSLK